MRYGMRGQTLAGDDQVVGVLQELVQVRHVHRAQAAGEEAGGVVVQVLRGVLAATASAHGCIGTLPSAGSTTTLGPPLSSGVRGCASKSSKAATRRRQ